MGQLARTRVDRRASLLGRLDQLRRRLDHVDTVREASSFQDKALSLIHSPEAVRAFDLSRERPTLRERYGMTPFGQGCLLARRLVEAGVRLVTVNWARDYQARVADHWDTHADNFAKHKKLLPAFDLGYTALLDDLTQRGQLDETLVVVIGEFGRTPKINRNAGRDHWPGCFSITLAGAGIRGGLVHGASDKMAAYPTRDAVSPEEVAATIYHALGIPGDIELVDHSGRPFRWRPANRCWNSSGRRKVWILTRLANPSDKSWPPETAFDNNLAPPAMSALWLLALKCGAKTLGRRGHFCAINSSSP